MRLHASVTISNKSMRAQALFPINAPECTCGQTITPCFSANLPLGHLTPNFVRVRPVVFVRRVREISWLEETDAIFSHRREDAFCGWIVRLRQRAALYTWEARGLLKEAPGQFAERRLDVVRLTGVAGADRIIVAVNPNVRAFFRVQEL